MEAITYFSARTSLVDEVDSYRIFGGCYHGY